MKFIWVDDDAKRSRTAKLLEDYSKQRKFKFTGRFINLHDSDVKLIFTESEPDLIIIDHFLNKSSNKTISQGSSVAEIVRERWPQCPIVGVTAAEKEARVEVFAKDNYEDLFSTDDHERMFSAILMLATGFHQLRKKTPKNVLELVNLLRPPKDDVEHIKKIIPQDVKQEINLKKNASLKISRWIRRSLLAKPGLLLDGLWMATTLGIKETSFSKIGHLFKTAQYSGIFSNYSGTRWWKNLALAKLYEQLKLEEPKLPWIAGHALKGVTKNDHVLCAVCNKRYPEIVGYLDQISKTRRPMHLKCTVEHPENEAMAFFEEMRMMKDHK